MKNHKPTKPKGLKNIFIIPSIALVFVTKYTVSVVAGLHILNLTNSLPKVCKMSRFLKNKYLLPPQKVRKKSIKKVNIYLSHQKKLL